MHYRSRHVVVATEMRAYLDVVVVSLNLLGRTRSRCDFVRALLVLAHTLGTQLAHTHKRSTHTFGETKAKMITTMTLGSLCVDKREKNLVIGDSNRSSGHTNYSHSEKKRHYDIHVPGDDDFEKRRVLLEAFFFLHYSLVPFAFRSAY